jgi:SpoVK/Ycf46/Vps4 family AAA+-type ATPase
MERIHEDVDLTRLSKLTEGFSGSDIREACRTASVYRMREISSSIEENLRKTKSGMTGPNISSEKEEISSGGDSKIIHNNLRAIDNDDLLKAVSKLRESKLHCGFNAPKFAGVGGLD